MFQGQGALVRGVGCGLAVLVVLTGPVEGGQRTVDAVAPTRSHTVGVLPFTNLSRAQADQWIGTGIAETLASDLPRM